MQQRAVGAERGARSAERKRKSAPRSALRAPPPRRGFTLLELLLATLISLLLMGAVYVAINVQLRHAQAGRDVIEQSALPHNLLARMSRDIKKCVTAVAPTPPPPLSTLPTDGSTPAAGASAGASTPGSGDSSTANPSTANPSTANPSTVNSSSSPGSSSISLPPATRDTIQFQLGVKGNSTALSLYISRLPSELDESRTERLSDLRLISYWLASDGSRPIGLARREYKRVTADEANGTPAATTDADLVAEEVQSLQFRYFDGTEWLDTWDGTQTGSDALTPIGPPLAIEITLGIVVPSGDNSAWGQPSFKLYRHVVPILTADGVAR